MSARRQLLEALGASYVGIQFGGEHPSVLFQDKVTGSTCSVYEPFFNEPNVVLALKDKRELFARLRNQADVKESLR